MSANLKKSQLNGIVNKKLDFYSNYIQKDNYHNKYPHPVVAVHIKKGDNKCLIYSDGLTYLWYSGSYYIMRK